MFQAMLLSFVYISYIFFKIFDRFSLCSVIICSFFLKNVLIFIFIIHFKTNFLTKSWQCYVVVAGIRIAAICQGFLHLLVNEVIVGLGVRHNFLNVLTRSCPPLRPNLVKGLSGYLMKISLFVKHNTWNFTFP